MWIEFIVPGKLQESVVALWEFVEEDCDILGKTITEKSKEADVTASRC